MSLPLLQLPVDAVQHIFTCLSTRSKHSLAIAMVGRPRPGDGASEQHVRALQTLLQRLRLPTETTLDMEDEDMGPETVPESELGAASAIAPMLTSAPPLLPTGAWPCRCCCPDVPAALMLSAATTASAAAGPAGVRLHTQHLRINCRLSQLDSDDYDVEPTFTEFLHDHDYDDDYEDTEPEDWQPQDTGAREDVAAMVERLHQMMALSWPAVAEVRGPAPARRRFGQTNAGSWCCS
jgi:hypothetical protein